MMVPQGESIHGAILIADDEEGVRESLAAVLREEGFTVTPVADGTAAIEALTQQQFDLVLSDIRMPGSDGLEVLRRAHEISPQTLVLLMTAHATVETAVEALRLGAQDYLLKPILFDDVLMKVRRLIEYRQLAWENQFLRRQVERRWDFDGLVGRSAAMQDIMERVRRVAPTRSTVLITGESGVGKEVVARAIHHFSDRSDHIFLPINCGAIPENLLESQLFGHLRGSFTGAVANQEGLFQRARGGTIFLDEIGDLPISLQVKLLRALEQREVLPVGATTPVRIDVRIVAATNSNLEKAIAEGRFRDDLFYRLNVFGIDIPPLRERREDIPPLIDKLVHLHNQDLKKNYKGVDGGTLKLFLTLPWRGNVRELDNVIEHAMILGDGEWIRTNDLPRGLNRDQESGASAPISQGDDLREAVRAYERHHIEDVLGRCGQDKRIAAKRLGVSLSSLYRKLEELGPANSARPAA